MIGQQLKSICEHTQVLVHNTKFEDAYHSEQHKLQQSVAQCKRLEHDNVRLAHENSYYRNELVPSYENVLELQAQALKDAEARSLELETTSRTLQEKHAQALELLKRQDQKVEGLQADVQVLSEARRSLRSYTLAAGSVARPKPVPTRKSKRRKPGNVNHA